MRKLRLLTAGLMLLGTAACKDALNVENTNNPDQGRALNRPSDVENLIASSYQAVHASTLGGSNDAIQPQAIVMSFESFSNLANFGMSLRSPIPRGALDNTRNNAANAGNYRDFLGLHRAARQAAVGLARVYDPNFTFFPSSAAQIARAKAFGHFCIGTALGNIALIYESGMPINYQDPAASTNPPPLPLMRYDSLMTYALAQLDTAFVYAGLTPTGGNGFPLPNTWIRGQGLTAPQFQALIRGYQARFMAGVARTPAERAAANWPQIITYSNAFVAAFANDLQVSMDPAAGWDVSWVVQHFASNQSNWHMGWIFQLGMGDTSGNYDSWLALTPVANKVPFLIISPDKRLPQGATRTAQQPTSATATPTVDGSATTNPTGANYIAYPYYRNRSSADWAGDPLANGWYDQFRFRAYFNASRIGVYPIMTTAEMRLLAAEGQIRGGLFDAAAANINATRVTRGGLPALPNGMAAATPVPGTTKNCVPRIPSGPTTSPAVCGNMFEAMKWEKRMETYFTGPYMGYTDNRGWGDLPAGTALFWPVPYQEIDTRQLMASPPPYTSNVGGVGSPSGAALGTYGI